MGFLSFVGALSVRRSYVTKLTEKRGRPFPPKRRLAKVLDK